ncbi:Dabb family protein [Poritiphilus flavus]|uniref:Dabb family protein n=1 Tax=Poritiphilus flavus TaxID=2697053 RepID=A0A6L9EEZ1_9FLAO|nr:Dabb family protein [Poritiphilus flavus]NAS13334.1 Dabb family protein [Poritiphilus flavus]
MILKQKFCQILLIAGFLILWSSCKEKQPENPENNVEVAMKEETSEMKSKERLLRHVVIFKFKDDASEEDVERVNMAFNALPEKIPVIKDFEWGLNDSPENFDQGFTHCYLLTFESEEDRDSIYAPHPAHKAFGESLQPYLEKVFVVDYWTNP